MAVGHRQTLHTYLHLVDQLAELHAKRDNMDVYSAVKVNILLTVDQAPITKVVLHHVQIITSVAQLLKNKYTADS